MTRFLDDVRVSKSERLHSLTIAAPTPGNEIEHMLLQARALVEGAVGKHRNYLNEHSVTALEAGDTAVADAAQSLTATARGFVGVVLPGDGSRSLIPLLDVLTRAGATGIEVKILAATRVLDDTDAVKRLERVAHRSEIRLVAAPLQETLLVDNSSALVRTQGGGAGDEACVVRSPALLRNLRALFAASWQGGVPLADHRRLGERSRTVAARRILVALSSGVTDEAAARNLGMSVRTYRRNVADIARELGARSRFQVGVRAAELGLLHPQDAGAA
ncbi:hypothetical protein [Actinoplanes friuliensis]|nr:hypothetical protein [Actinoplanes friuliensis]